MSEKQNMLATSEPWDLVASGYAETTMLMLAEYSEAAIQKLDVNSKDRVLDVACGPGTASLMLADKVGSVHAIDFSAAMLKICQRNIRENNFENVEVFHGDAQELPYENDSFDAALSMFGLMFFPDRAKGLSEIYRTLKTGGRVAISSWAPVNRSPAMEVMFGALRAIKPDLPEPKTAVASLENPEVLEEELLAAGFKHIAVECVQKSFPVESIQGFWNGMVKGSAPITMMKEAMGDVWAEKEKLAIAYLEDMLPNTPTELTSDAWLATGVK